MIIINDDNTVQQQQKGSYRADLGTVAKRNINEKVKLVTNDAVFFFW